MYMCEYIYIYIYVIGRSPFRDVRMHRSKLPLNL